MFIKLGQTWVDFDKVTHFESEPPLSDGTELTSIHFVNRAKPILMAKNAREIARAVRTHRKPGVPGA